VRLLCSRSEGATPYFWELNISQVMWSSTLTDDMGLKILPPKSGEILLEIIMRRYENRSTMMTSNRPIEEWGKLLSDVPSASAILDRLLHHAEIIAINARSYRLQPKAKRSAPSERTAQKPVTAFCFQSLLARCTWRFRRHQPHLAGIGTLSVLPRSSISAFLLPSPIHK
jgi:hypothetical protein